MRGVEVQEESLFSYVSVEKRVPENHPLRPMKPRVDAVRSDLTGEFDRMYSEKGRPRTSGGRNGATGRTRRRKGDDPQEKVGRQAERLAQAIPVRSTI